MSSLDRLPAYHSDAAEHIAFTLSAQERTNAANALIYVPKSSYTRFTPFFIAAFGLFAFVHWILFAVGPSLAQMLSAIAYTIIATAWEAQAGLPGTVVARYIPRRVDLVFAESITGAIDGKPVVIQWHQIVRAHKTNEFLLLSLAAFPRSVVIPRRALDDGGIVLWRVLDKRLTGIRYLYRSPGPREIIINTRTAKTGTIRAS